MPDLLHRSRDFFHPRPSAPPQQPGRGHEPARRKPRPARSMAEAGPPASETGHTAAPDGAFRPMKRPVFEDNGAFSGEKARSRARPRRPRQQAVHRPARPAPQPFGPTGCIIFAATVRNVMDLHYLCITQAAPGKPRASPLCPLWHWLCITQAAPGKPRAREQRLT